MHIPDGCLTTRVWGAMDLVAAPVVGLLARRAQRDFDHHKVPLMGVMGAFIFAAQMINFPVGNGTSGHLVGGALLAMTLGPAAATIVMTAILATQALVFQDGGLLALGTNVFNMAIAGVWLGYLPFALLRGRKAGVFLGGTISLLASASLAMAELMISRIPMPPAVLAVSSLLFVVSALIEGAITLAVVQALEKIQPGFLREPKGLSGAGRMTLAIGSAGLAAVGIFIASVKPDGIESLAQQSGVWSRVTTLFHAPLADYQTAFVSSSFLGKSLAGLAGIVVIYALCFVISRVLTATAGSRSTAHPREGV
jgi:cobalt/nickel transport system permease protein